MRLLLTAVTAGVLALPATGPAHAGTGGDGTVTVTIADSVLANYGCQTLPVQVGVAAGALSAWTVSVVAAPVGRARLDAVAFSGRGPAVQQGTLLMCPADSAGPWSASVSSRVGLTVSDFAVTFDVSRQATSTVVTRARSTATTVRVRGTVLTPAGLAGRAPLTVRGLRNGSWRLLGHTAAGAKGGFRFVAPRSVRSVEVTYPGDAVTTPSQARMRAVRVD